VSSKGEDGFHRGLGEESDERPCKREQEQDEAARQAR